MALVDRGIPASVSTVDKETSTSGGDIVFGAPTTGGAKPSRFPAPTAIEKDLPGADIVGAPSTRTRHGDRAEKLRRAAAELHICIGDGLGADGYNQLLYQLFGDDD